MEYEAPVVCPPKKVLKPWVDYNDHMNLAYYSVVFDQALDHIFDRLGIGEAYAKAGQGSCFTLEVHICYLQELSLGDPLRVTWQLLDWDPKRIHYFEAMYHADEGYLAAVSEHISLHVSLQTRRSAPLPEPVQEALRKISAAHGELPRPAQVGRVIGIRR